MSSPGRVANRTVGTTSFTSHEVNQAIELINNSGAAAAIEPLLPVGGRPRELTVRALMVGLLLVTRSGQPTYLNRIPAVLNAFTAYDKKRLGIKGTVTDRKVGHVCRLTVAALRPPAATVAKPPKGDANPKKEKKQEEVDPEVAAAMAAEEARVAAEALVAADARLQDVLDRLMAVTLPGEDEYQTDGHLAFDATIIDANSRPEHTIRRRKLKQAIKEARKRGESGNIEDVLRSDEELAKDLGIPTWGEDPLGHADGVARAKASYRQPADPEASTIVYKGRLRHSYAVHLAVDIPSLKDVKQRLARQANVAEAKRQGVAPTEGLPMPVPAVVRRMVVTASTAAPGETGSQLLSTMAGSPVGTRNGWKPADVVADRGYTNADPANWHNPLRGAGFSLVHDLHKVRRGVTHRHDGVVILDGQAYSPGILDRPELLTDKAIRVGSTRAVIDAHLALLEERRPYLLPFHGKPDLNQASVRVTCPALRGKLECPLRGLTGNTNVPFVYQPPAAPLPLICTAKTVTVPADLLAHAQDNGLLYGSVDWYDSFVRRRPRVEGVNGNIKNPAGGHLSSMRIRVRGRAAVSLFVAFIVMSANLAAVESWRAECSMTLTVNSEAAKARRSRKQPPHRHPGHQAKVLAGTPPDA